MTNDEPPGSVRRMFRTVVHGIPPGYRLGGPRVAAGLLNLFGEQLLQALAASAQQDLAALPEQPAPAPRAPQQQQLDDVMQAWGRAAANDPVTPHTETRST